MAYRLRYDRGFMQQLAALPGDVRSIARRAVLDLAETPRPTRAKELDEHRGYYRRGCRVTIAWSGRCWTRTKLLTCSM